MSTLRNTMTAATALAVLAAGPVRAGPAVDGLKACMVKSASESDKHELMRWLFSVMSLSPDVHSLTSITADQRLESDKFVGKLFSRLLTADCRAETVAAMREDKNGAIDEASSALGEASMLSLMRDHDVQKGVAAFAQYMDVKGITEVVVEASVPPPDHK